MEEETLKYLYCTFFVAKSVQKYFLLLPDSPNYAVSTCCSSLVKATQRIVTPSRHFSRQEELTL